MSTADAVTLPHLTIDRRRPFDALFRHEPALAGTLVLLVFLLPPILFALQIDDRTLNDVNVWVKPTKFSASLIVYVATLLVLARYVPVADKARGWYRLYMAAVVTAIVLEMAWLVGAAALGVAAHFNTTPAGAAIYRSMGAAAVLLTSASAVQAWLIWRNRSTGLSPAVKESIVTGLALTLPLTLLTAGTLASMQGHWIGGVPSDAAGMVLTGWARDGGDLRVSHFFATHALQLLPLFGLLWAAFGGGQDRRPGRVFAVLYTCLMLATFRQALAGRPFLPFIG